MDDNQHIHHYIKKIGDSGPPCLKPFFLEDEWKIFGFRTLDNQCELLLGDHPTSLLALWDLMENEFIP